MVQLTGAEEVGADDDYGLACLGAGDCVRERDGERFWAECGFDFGKSIGREWLTLFRYCDNVRAVVAEFGAQSIARMMGKSTGSIEICELKMERPIW